jgi:hypothetical protein
MVEKKDSLSGLDDDDMMAGNYDESAALFVTLLPTPEALSSSTTPLPPPPPTPPPSDSGAPGDGREEESLPPAYAHVVNANAVRDGQVDSNHDGVKCGAGVASGMFGMLVGGPVLAILLGLGTAYAADQPGAAGDAARSVGEVAIVAQNKFKKLDEEHKFVERSKVVAAEAVQKLQEADRDHRLVDRFKDFATRSFQSVSLYVKEHRLLERGTQAVGQAAYWAAHKLADKVQSHQQHQQQQGSGGGSSTTAQYRAVRGRDTLDDNSKKSLVK